MYNRINYWPLHGFVHKATRGAADLHRRRLRDDRKSRANERAKAEVLERARMDTEAEVKRKKACEEDMGLEERATAGSESLPKHVNDSDTTMAIDDAVMEDIVKEISRMSVDPDRSTNPPGVY